MNLIKIGLEASWEHLRNEMISHPDRYFFILVIENRAVLCIETCDSRGENLQYHIVDALTHDSDGDLVSVFDEEINIVMKDCGVLNSVIRGNSDDEVLYPISVVIADKIKLLSGFIEWMISTILIKDRNILIYPASWSSEKSYRTRTEH